MNRFFRFYNQNKLEFWIMVLIIIFIIIMLQVFNGFAIEENQRKASQSNENVVSEEEQRKQNVNSNPIVNGNKLNETSNKENVDIIENFLQCCKNGEIEKAYNLLSTDCKESKYDSISVFEETYVKNRFSSNVLYSYELWDSSKGNVYRVKIFENALASGNVNASYKEDYFTIQYENGQYKININYYNF